MDTSPESPTSGANEHLSFPVIPDESPAESSASISTPAPRTLLKDRLYIGNLHPSVDEYSLLQLFSKFGKVTKLDFLFHKAGALKGKPRGYAFVEYDSPDDARKALSKAHDKLLRGRKLVVTFAHQAPLEQGGTGTGMYGAKRRNMMETGRPTTLSLLKSSAAGKHDGTRDKIAMMEAKLRQMESTNPRPAPIPGSSASGPASAVNLPSASAMSSTTPLYHSSLPPKPPPPIPETAAQMQARPAKPKTPLPQLPLSQQARASHVQGASSYLPKTSAATSINTLARIAVSSTPAATTTTARPAKTKLSGVKLGVKKKANVPLNDEKG